MATRGLYGQSSNGEAWRGDAGPGKVRQSWIVQFRHRVAGIGRAGKENKNGKGYNKSNSAPRWNTCLYPAGSRTDGNISKCTDADAYGAWETCL